LGKLRISQDSLAAMSGAAKSEHVVFTVSVEGTDCSVTTVFGLSEVPPIVLSVRIPRRMAELLIDGGPTVTWNHIDIGYWGRWKRDSDKYPSNFMRLLQLGYVAEMASQREMEEDQVLSLSVAEIIQANPDFASKVLGRAGLPCISCQHQVSETLGQAMKIHAVGASQKSLAVSELSAIFSSVE
jgi:hypothetical protein